MSSSNLAFREQLHGNIKLASETVEAKLLQEDHRREDNQDTTSASALVKKCFTCQEAGHLMRNCPLVTSGGKSGQGEDKEASTDHSALLTALSVSVDGTMKEESKKCVSSTLTSRKASQGNGNVKEEVQQSASLASSSSKVSQEVWHQRLGHLNSRSMGLLNRGMATGIKYDSADYKSCVACIEGKQSRLPFPSKSSSRADEVLGLVHTDLCGPMQKPSFSGARYFLLFIDDFTRKTYVYFLKTKNETFESFRQFKALVENQTERKIKILRSDGGGEFVNSQFQKFLKEAGIRHQTTVPHSPAQNGVVERANRTVMEAARCMMQQAGLGMEYWAEAVNTAVYLKNRSPTRAVMGATPEEAWTNKKVDLNNLRVFGCIAYALVKNRKKLDSKSKLWRFVGYCTETKGYRLIDPTDPRKFTIARDVVFLEDKFKIKELSHDDKVFDMNMVFMHSPPPNMNDSNSSLSECNEQSTEPSVEGLNQSDDINSDSVIDNNSKDDSEDAETSGEIDDPLDSTYVPGSSSLEEDTDYEESAEFAAFNCDMQSSATDEPTTVREAMSGSEAEQWRAAMSDEYDSFKKNNCWTLVDRPANHKAVKCKWVFKRKRGLDGEILRYKARLVAKGYTQTYGVDYEETFAPVVRYSTIRMLLAIAAEYNMEIDHMDVITAFLNGDLKEQVYMEQPEGFEIKGGNGKVYKLNKAIYGLKQAAKSWYDKLDTALTQNFGFKRVSTEPCVYFKSHQGKPMIISIYVDDILLFTSCSAEEKKKLKDKLMKEFAMRDLGAAHHILGMKITNKDGRITLDQSNYIQTVLNKFQMSDCKPASTPMEAGLKLHKAEKLVCTRPDIAYAVSSLSQFNQSYAEVHWKAAKRVLRYLKGTINHCLTFEKNGLSLTAYVDADWAASAVDRKSYTGRGHTPHCAVARAQQNPPLIPAAASRQTMSLAEGASDFETRTEEDKRERINSASSLASKSTKKTGEKGRQMSDSYMWKEQIHTLMKGGESESDISDSEHFLTKGAFLLTPSHGLSMEKASTICEKMEFKGCFSLTKTATGILFKFSNVDDYQMVFKKGFHKVTGSRFYRKIAIPCRPQKTFTIYVYDVPDEVPEEDVRHALYKFCSVVEVVRLHFSGSPREGNTGEFRELRREEEEELSSKVPEEDVRHALYKFCSVVEVVRLHFSGSPREGNTGTSTPKPHVDKSTPRALTTIDGELVSSMVPKEATAVLRVTLANIEEANILLQNGLDFYGATYFPTELGTPAQAAKLIKPSRVTGGSVSARVRDLLPVFDQQGFARFAPPASRLVKPSGRK
ncbi:unnamed protein product [Plutella xylostella]|uniref:(diamondback moth) hypothetical protein n=1 Tax=Plutella xylostella TaxID=51655 RepID=A0A8S4G820_PLUXY|nr:unnamed protein product [Plutella xylostella]